MILRSPKNKITIERVSFVSRFSLLAYEYTQHTTHTTYEWKRKLHKTKSNGKRSPDS